MRGGASSWQAVERNPVSLCSARQIRIALRSIRATLGWRCLRHHTGITSHETKMTDSNLRGVIAAIPTAVDENGEPDCARSTALAGYLLAKGCDGLNVLGTTGEATSFTRAQRK